MNTRGLMELIALNIGYDLGIFSLFTMALARLTGPLLTLFGNQHAASEAFHLPLTQEPTRRLSKTCFISLFVL